MTRSALVLRILVGLGGFELQAQPPVARYALLIGVDEYPVGIPALTGGPANDLILMQGLLVKRLKVPADHIRILRNREVTRDGIIQAIREHLGQAGPEDLALLYFTGHGLRIDANIGLSREVDTEPDDRDEALLVWSTDTTRATVLVDEELGLLLDGLRAGRAIAIIDACHAGTSTRATAEGVIRWTDFGRERPPALRERAPRTSMLAPKRVLSAVTEPTIEIPELLLTAGTQPKSREHQLWAAANNDEIAFQGPLRMPDGVRRTMSLFSTTLYQALWSASPAVTLDSLMRGVRATVDRITRRAMGVSQSPHLEGPGGEATLADVLGLPPRPRPQRRQPPAGPTPSARKAQPR